MVFGNNTVECGGKDLFRIICAELRSQNSTACFLGAQFHAKVLGPFPSAGSVPSLAQSNQKYFFFPFHGLDVSPERECVSQGGIIIRSYNLKSKVSLASGFYRLVVRELLDAQMNCVVNCRRVGRAKVSNMMIPGSGMVIQVKQIDNPNTNHHADVGTQESSRCYAVPRLSAHSTFKSADVIRPSSGQWIPLPQGKWWGVLLSGQRPGPGAAVGVWKPQCECLGGSTTEKRSSKQDNIHSWGLTAEEISVTLCHWAPVFDKASPVLWRKVVGKPKHHHRFREPN